MHIIAAKSVQVRVTKVQDGLLFELLSGKFDALLPVMSVQVSDSLEQAEALAVLNDIGFGLNELRAAATKKPSGDLVTVLS